MKKFVTAIIISFVVTVSSAGIKAAAFSSSNLGAAFVLSNVMSDEKNDKNGSGITVIDGNREDIKFSLSVHLFVLVSKVRLTFKPCRVII